MCKTNSRQEICFFARAPELPEDTPTTNIRSKPHVGIASAKKKRCDVSTRTVSDVEGLPMKAALYLVPRRREPPRSTAVRSRRVPVSAWARVFSVRRGTLSALYEVYRGSLA